MNSRERLERCFKHQETDRPGVYTRTGYPANDPTYDKLKEYMLMHSDLKIPWAGWDAKEAFEIQYSAQPYSQDYERIICNLNTPEGKLQSSYFRGLTGKPGMHETYFINNREDAEKYLSLPFPRITVEDVSTFLTAEKEVGDRGIVDVCVGTNSAGYVEELMGSENFAVMSITDRDIIHELCERRMKILLNAVKALKERNIGPFYSLLGQEYIVPPMHGVNDFYDFNVRYDKPIIDLIHNAGGYVHVHCHGSVKKVLQGFLDMEVDVMHPFEAPPMGDITAAEAKEIIGDRICMEGNIQISHMYEHTPEQIREETRKLISDAFYDHKGLIVCPTASPYIFGKGLECFEQFKAMVDTVLE
jgi:hypothetical protein